MKRFTREELLPLARRQPEVLVDLFLDLQARLNLNSTNSSRPPATDGLAKPAPKSSAKKPAANPVASRGIPATPCCQSNIPTRSRSIGWAAVPAASAQAWRCTTNPCWLTNAAKCLICHPCACW